MTCAAPPDPSSDGDGRGTGEDPVAAAATFAALFRAIYLTYHRRDGPRSGLTGASRTVLGHLATPRP